MEAEITRRTYSHGGCNSIFSGNLLVLFVYARTSTMKTPSNRLLVSLSLADLLMMSKSWVLVINMWNNGPVLGLPGKELILTCFITCLLVSCAFIRLLGPLFYSNYCVLCYLFRVPFSCKMFFMFFLSFFV